MSSTLPTPTTDPTPIFEFFRGSYATELLTAAVSHFRLFEHLAVEPLTLPNLGRKLGLAERPMIVLTTALRAMGLLDMDGTRRLAPSRLAAEHLIAGGAFDVTGYIGLAADSANVLEMAERLRSNRPIGSTALNSAEPGAEESLDDDAGGVAFIYREGEKSAMEQEATARHLTLSLAGRARNVAPYLARQAELEGAELLLDVGGGSGIYAIACLQKHPHLKAVVWDRPHVLQVAAEMAEEYGVSTRLECVAGDMFADPVPVRADCILLSNVLHDWDVPECRSLIARCADALRPNGQLLIHDVFLNDKLDGPLPIALYSAALFSLTEGRAYSAAEYRTWLEEAGLTAGEVRPTLVHCGVLVATR